MKTLTWKSTYRWIVICLLLIPFAYAIANFDIRARQTPSRAETLIATSVKHWLVASAVQREPPVPPFEALEKPIGQMLFMACCAKMIRDISLSVENSSGYCSAHSVLASSKSRPTESMSDEGAVSGST